APWSSTPGECSPNAGRRIHGGSPSVAAPYVNSATNASANQKLGAAYTTVVNTVSNRSDARPRRTAWSIPTGTPTRNVSASDAIPSPIDTGNACASALTTG